MNYVILITLIFCSILSFKLIKDFKNIKRLSSFNKKNFYNWMKLTKRERYNLTNNDSLDYLNRRKVLLNQIRQEYKNISKNKKRLN